MSIKRTEKAIAEAQKTHDVHYRFMDMHPGSTTGLIEWYWQQRLKIAERIGRGKEEKEKS